MIQRELKRVFILTLAIFFLLLGLAGLVLPILQGWLFLAISILLFSLYSPRLRAWVDRHTMRWPKLHAAVGKAEEWIVKVVGRPE